MNAEALEWFELFVECSYADRHERWRANPELQSGEAFDDHHRAVAKRTLPERRRGR